jgi:hypothetical protein
MHLENTLAWSVLIFAIFAWVIIFGKVVKVGVLRASHKIFLSLTGKFE